jgi:hypothetical protein
VIEASLACFAGWGLMVIVVSSAVARAPIGARNWGRSGAQMVRQVGQPLAASGHRFADPADEQPLSRVGEVASLRARPKHCAHDCPRFEEKIPSASQRLQRLAGELRNGSSLLAIAATRSGSRADRSSRSAGSAARLKRRPGGFTCWRVCLTASRPSRTSRWPGGMNFHGPSRSARSWMPWMMTPAHVTDGANAVDDRHVVTVRGAEGEPVGIQAPQRQTGERLLVVHLDRVGRIVPFQSGRSSPSPRCHLPMPSATTASVCLRQCANSARTD